MKWFNLLLLVVIVLPFTACEKHEKSDLAKLGISTEQNSEKSDSKQGTEPGKAPAESGTAKPFFPDSK